MSLKINCSLALLCCSVFLFASQTIRAGTIQGRVTDADNGEPVFYANIFLAHTTIGTTSDSDGRFNIANIRDGLYELVVHYIGYKTEVRQVDLLEQRVIELDIELTPEVLSGEEIEVVAKEAKTWRKLLRRFTRAFIGTSKNASKCTIKNPEVLDFNAAGGILNAFTDSLLMIENRALGYQVDIVLESFILDERLQSVTWAIYPKFSEMTAASERQAGEWLNNREQTYKGSLRHFLCAMVHGQSYQQGFMAYFVPRVVSTEDVRLVGQKDLIFSHSDDKYYIYLSAPIWVLYGMQRDTQSWLSMKFGATIIDSYGNYWDQNSSLWKYGHWASYRVADYLPFEYRLAGIKTEHNPQVMEMLPD